MTRPPNLIQGISGEEIHVVPPLVPRIDVLVAIRRASLWRLPADAVLTFVTLKLLADEDGQVAGSFERDIDSILPWSHVVNMAHIDMLLELGLVTEVWFKSRRRVLRIEPAS